MGAVPALHHYLYTILALVLCDFAIFFVCYSILCLCMELFREQIFMDLLYTHIVEYLH